MTVVKEKQRGDLLVGKETLEKDVVQVIEATRRLMELYYLSGDSEGALRESRKLDSYINFYQLEIKSKGEK